MTIPLRHATASQEIPLGFFVDSGDGNTEETALSIANTDIKLWKSGATTLANKNSGGATHISNGIYYAVLDATDTNTIGPLVIFVHVSGALYVKVTCLVLEEPVYDALIAGSAVLDTNVKKVNGTDQTAGDVAALLAALDSIVDNIHDTDLPAVKTDTAAILVDTNELQTDLHDGGRLDLLIDGIKGVTDDLVSKASVVDAIWDEDVDSSHQTAGSAGKKLDEAGSAGDPWGTALPGSYGPGTAGKIVGDNLNAPVSTVDTVVDSIKTTVDDLHAMDLPAVKSVLDDVHNTDLPAVKADTEEVLTRLPDAPPGGNGGLPTVDANNHIKGVQDAVEVNDKTGFALSASGIDAILDEVVEGPLTMRQVFRIFLSALAEKSNGGGTSTITFRDHGDTKNRITATVDENGNRMAIALDGT